MANMSSYQRHYWYEKIAELQGGEFCKGCGIAPNSNWTNKKIKGLVIDKINNDGNHTIADNQVKDFQLLCRHCNYIKNPVGLDLPKEQTQSEATNRRAEKPLMEWLFKLLHEEKKIITWDYFVSEGSFKFDISPETIERRYFKKYFKAPSAPFELYVGSFEQTCVKLKEFDIDTQTPTFVMSEMKGETKYGK